MAQKTIGELELKASILTTDNVVVDDGTNSYKATIAQLATAVLPAQTSNNFKALQTNGSTTFWGDLNTGALCSTAGATADKTVDFTNFVLSNFCKISVKFSNANTADSPTLNVNGTGAKAIKINNSTTTDINWKAGAIIDFLYDGSDWVISNVPLNIANRFSAPDISTAVSISSGYVTTYAGWLYVRSTGNITHFSFVSVDGVIMYYRDTDSTSVIGSIFMVAKGATIILGGTGTFNEVIYYACMGE